MGPITNRLNPRLVDLRSEPDRLQGTRLTNHPVNRLKLRRCRERQPGEIGPAIEVVRRQRPNFDSLGSNGKVQATNSCLSGSYVNRTRFVLAVFELALFVHGDGLTQRLRDPPAELGRRMQHRQSQAGTIAH